MYAVLNINDKHIFRRCIPELSKAQAENTPCSGDGERNDDHKMKERGKEQAGGWRREETEREKESWSHPRRYNKYIFHQNRRISLM